MDIGTIAVGSAIRDADLTAADLHGRDLGGVTIRNTEMFEADLHGTNLGAADLSGINLNRADLRDAVLADATLENVELNEADLRGADFGGADLTNVSFFKSDLRGADFTGADLTDVRFRMADLRGTKGLPNQTVPFAEHPDHDVMLRELGSTSDSLTEADRDRYAKARDVAYGIWRDASQAGQRDAAMTALRSGLLNTDSAGEAVVADLTAARDQLTRTTAVATLLANILADEGLPETAIAERLGVDRGKTVRRWLGK